MLLNRLSQITALVALTLILSGCEAIGTIFQIGMWTGVIMVVLVVAAVGFIVAKVRR